MEAIKSQFKRWTAGELTLLGSFQTRLFRAFQVADGDNQLKLSTVFPYWFLEIESAKGEFRKSKIADVVIKQMSQDLISEIKTYLDESWSLEFDDAVNLSYALEKMKSIVKRNDKYLLLTTDNSSGEEYSYEIVSSGSISIDDLIWILEQIEDKLKGR